MGQPLPIDGPASFSDEQALQWLRGQPGGQVETTVSALAQQLAWSRSTLRRRMATWSDRGLITRGIGTNGRSTIKVVGQMATDAVIPVDRNGHMATSPEQLATDTATLVGCNGHAAASPEQLATPSITLPTSPWINAMAVLAALSLASISAYFSILGLAAIFAAAFWPVVVMAAALEFGRLVTTAWLSRHWGLAPSPLKWVLTAMVVVLMGITSMGVFGFLTKTHVDQRTNIAVSLGDQGAAIEGQMALQSQVVADLDRRIGQIDAAIEAATSRGRSTAAMALAAQEGKTRLQLVASRQKEARTLAELQIHKATLDGDRKRMEAEIGPIRYLAQLVGGADADVEKTVRLLILVIAAVFDPLAVLLLIAATHSRRETKENYLSSCPGYIACRSRAPGQLIVPQEPLPPRSVIARR